MVGKRTPVAYVALWMRYPSPQNDGPLPQVLLDYHGRVREWIERLRKLPQVGVVISSAEDFEHKGREWWQEDHGIGVLELRVADRIADRIVRFIRRLGIRRDHSFGLQKQVLLDNGDRDVWLLAFLDRLRRGGVFEGIRGRATVLLYWSDDLTGRPHMEKAP